jgi:hypothetical protein
VKGSWVDDEFPPTKPEAARGGNPAFCQWRVSLLKCLNAITTNILDARDEGDNLTV